MAERKTRQYPLIIFQGGLDSLVNKVHLAVGKIILCISEKTLAEGTLALLATFYVFMYEYPSGLVHFFALQKSFYRYKMAESCHLLSYTL